MDREKYKEDLQDIRDIMDRSSRFISLSGLSGIIVGVIAISGAWLAWSSVYSKYEIAGFERWDISDQEGSTLVLLAIGTMVLSIGSVILLTSREAKKKGQKVWDFQTQRILLNLAIPLVAGGIICLFFLREGLLSLLPSFTLIFYGLALINTSKFTVDEIRSLGYIELALGLLALLLLEQGLIIWGVGFGLVHIVYGIIAHRKYNS